MSKRVKVVSLVIAGVLLGGCAKPAPAPTSIATILSETAKPTNEPDGSAGAASTPVPSPATSPTSSGASSPVPSEGPVALTVEARDLAFTPRELEAPANGEVVISLHNGGRIVHNLTIDELHVQLIASPGQTTSEDLADLPAGTYTYYCSVSGHREAGMFGTLTVK